MDSIEKADINIKYSTEAQPNRRQKQRQAPSTNKQFFEEVDEASSLLKTVLRENMDWRER